MKNTVAGVGKRFIRRHIVFHLNIRSFRKKIFNLGGLHIMNQKKLIHIN